jgi:hypothetical protein
LAAPHAQDWLQEQENHLFQGRQQAVETALEALAHLEPKSKEQLLEYLKTTATAPVMVSTAKKGCSSVVVWSCGSSPPYGIMSENEKKRTALVRKGMRPDGLAQGRKRGKFHVITDLF